MGRPATDDPMIDFANLALVAPELRVLYLPTPKAACTTMKLMLAEAAGTHRPEMAARMAVMHLSSAQTIHHPAVHGLTRLVELTAGEQRTALESSDWLRITSLRDPVARAYSAWENRIFMRGHRRTTEVIALAPDVSTDGRLDLAASFAGFARALTKHLATFMVDHHFWPQSHLVRRDLVDFTHIVRVDRAGALDTVADLLRERSDKAIVAARLNEGLGVKVDRVCDHTTAGHLMTVYHDDYERLGFERRDWPSEVQPLHLSDMEVRLLNGYRNVLERGISVAGESRRRSGARYGASQVRRALTRRLRGRAGNDPKEIQP